MRRYQPELWQSHRWQTDTRYYMAEISQDLWGHWLIRREWGGRTNARGNAQSLSVASYEEALVLLNATFQRRAQRGYTPVGFIIN